MAAAVMESAVPLSTGAKVKGPKIDPVAKPDLEGIKAQLATSNDTVKALYERLEAIQTQIRDAQKGSQDFNARRDECRRNLDEISAKIETLESERKRLLSDVDEMQKVGRDMKTKVQSLKKELGFETAEDIDKAIRDIETHMMGNRTSLMDEKKFIAQIAALKKSKPLIGQYAHMESDAANHAQSAVLPLRVRLDQVREELKQKQLERRVESDRLREILDERNKVSAPLKAVFEEREEIRREIAEHRQTMSNMREEMAVKNREYSAYLAQVKMLKEDQQREERKRRAAETEVQELEDKLNSMDDVYVSPEFQLLQQTVVYLRKLVAKLKDIQSDGKEDTCGFGTGGAGSNGGVMSNGTGGGKAVDDEGLVAMKPKNQRDEEFYFAPTRTKGTPKNKKRGPSRQQPLIHDIRTLADFERLGFQPPLTLDACPPCLDVLEKKLTKLRTEQALLNEDAQKKKEALIARLEALKKDRENAKDKAAAKATNSGDNTPESKE